MMNHEMATNSKMNFRDIDTFLIGVVTHKKLKAARVHNNGTTGENFTLMSHCSTLPSTSRNCMFSAKKKKKSL